MKKGFAEAPKAVLQGVKYQVYFQANLYLEAPNAVLQGVKYQVQFQANLYLETKMRMVCACQRGCGRV